MKNHPYTPKLLAGQRDLGCVYRCDSLSRIRYGYLSREHISHSQEGVSLDVVFIIAIRVPEIWPEPVATMQVHSAG